MKRVEHEMEIFESLISAKKHGTQLAKEGHTPSIYIRDHREFILVANRELPPPGAMPFLKWVGKDYQFGDEDSEWIPILTRLDNFIRAKEACALFYLLGHNPIIVEYRSLGIFDLFLRESDIPQDAWVVTDEDEDYDMLELHPPPIYYEDDEDLLEFEVPLNKE
ncbi:MAG: hypothetical protein ACFFEF_09815 [Candidatus Thorarchaeota archaeon]